MINEDDVMPSGAEIPEAPEETEVETEEVVEAEPILGKFKSQEELAAAYQALEKKIGEQGNELGSTKQMNAMMLEQFKALQAQNQTPAKEVEKDAFNFDAQMEELRAGVESGDISFEKALVLSANLASERATRDAMAKFDELSASKQRAAAKEKFLTDNPDFIDLQKTGKLDAVKKQLPGMHDDFSAYYAYKAEEAASAARNLQETKRIAAGDENTAKVLNKPGTKSNNIGKPTAKITPAELKARTLAKLEGVD